MADVNNTDVRTATNASNTTRYFHLPLFIASDKPSWLVDWNGAMGDIDNILQDIATASEGAVADVATIQSQIDALNATIPNLEALVNTAVSDMAAMQTTVNAQEDRLDAVETDLITQNNLIKTLSDAVTTMQGTVATLNNRVGVMETSLSTYNTLVDTLSDNVDNLSHEVTPAFGDLSFTSNLTDITNISAPTDVYTATATCYVIISLYCMNALSTQQDQFGAFRAAINNTRVSTCLANGPGASAYDFSGMIKLKAGDTISISLAGTATIASASCEVNVALA